MKVLPLGSVIRIKSARAMISGYYFNEESDCWIGQYVVLPYPQGLRRSSDLKMVPFDYDVVVEHECTPTQRSLSVSKGIEMLAMLSEKLTAAEFREVMKNYLREELVDHE